MSLKKTNGVGLKRGKITQGEVLVHKSYTDDRKNDYFQVSVNSYFGRLC